jgi:hypothetical protein
MAKPMTITQDRLKSILRYDPDTGRLFWIAARRNKIQPGSMAGNLNPDGYRRIKIDGRQFFVHKIVWLYVHGVMAKDQLDHINHCKDDNRIENLREVSNQENHRNQPIYKNNTSGVPGVYWKKPANKWQARIMTGMGIKNLGYFKDYFEAVCARKSADLTFGYHENHGAKRSVSRNISPFSATPPESKP